MPRVSIGLPVFNGENYVRQSIESILTQTYEDFEFIISDNASTDSTPDICREYAARDPRVRYVQQHSNCGLSKNSNFVFEQSKCEYFKWVSHDDIHAPTFVQRCVEALDQNPSAVMACPRGVIIDGHGEVLRVARIDGQSCAIDTTGRFVGCMRPYDPPRQLDSPSPSIRFGDLLLHTGWCLEYYGLMRANILRRTPLNGDFYGADKPLLAELVLHGRFIDIPEILLFYRQHPAQEKLYRASASLKQTYVTGNLSVRFEIPRAKLLRGYWRAIFRAPLSLTERLACIVQLGKWMGQWRKWGTVWRELPQLMIPAFKAMMTTNSRLNSPGTEGGPVKRGH
jgi:glycosyltransferase involved in cell wall biosynthesis